MNISVILLQSLDGYIAKSETDNLSWSSRKDKIFLFEKIREIGTVMMGRKTYEQIPKQKLEGIDTYIFSRCSKFKEKCKSDNSNTYILNCSVSAGCSNLERNGVNQVAVIGGSEIVSQFFGESRVDELYLTIAPFLFGGGLKSLTFKTPKQIKLSLLESKLLSKDEILLHYSVKK